MKSIGNNELRSSSSIIEILNLISNQNNNEKKRLAALNSGTKLVLLANSTEIITTEEFFYCLSSNYVHQLTQIRAGAIRLTRYLLKTLDDLEAFNRLNLPFLVCRSLDLVVKNEEERIQALKLIRKIIMISPEHLSLAIVRCLVSLCDTLMIDGQKPDRIVRACLATLSELGVLNPLLLIVSNGIAVITRNVCETDSPRIAESLVGVLLHLLEYPQTRNLAGIRLDCLAASYCDFTYRLGIMDKNKDARELRFKCSRLALLSVLRSWNGTLEFCNPNKASGLKAIIDVLYLNQLEVRKAILDLMYELINLPQPVWTDEYSVALAAVDPSDYQDSWRLAEGFVALEGRSILPSFINKVPNICETHQAFLLYCFIENGLLNALIEVITQSDTFISVRATILLAKLLHMIHLCLPADLCNISPSLPLLISKATEGNHLARASISALQAYHNMIKNRPASCSLYLDSIIQNGELIKSRLFKREIDAAESLSKSASLTLERIRTDSVGSADASTAGSYNYYYDYSRDTTSLGGVLSDSGRERALKKSLIPQKVFAFFEKFRENERLIKNSMVLIMVDHNAWDWETIVTIFRNKTLSAKIDENQLRFIKTLTHYFKPSSNKFSHMELGMGRIISPNVHAGIMLIDYLLDQIDELEYMRILTDFCSDISLQLQAIYKKKAHDCLFSPSHMYNTMCQQYFLFIGRMCRSKKGIDILKNTDILKHLMHLVENTNHTIYVKLIISGLDYSQQPNPRLILEKALTLSPNQASRLYATQFLLILLRARIPTFEEWGVTLILNQLKDKDRAIMLATLEIIEEACHENIYLLEFVSLEKWPRLEEYHEMGKYIMMQFYSVPRGLHHPNANVENELKLWVNVYNKKYVLFVESEIHSSLTLHTKNEDGLYMSRNSLHQRQMPKTTHLPFHLYGALVQTQRGICHLQKHGNVAQLIDAITYVKCGNEEECLQLKSALWAVGHVATNADGIDFLNNGVSRIFEKIIRLATFHDVYSVRSTAFHVVCLMSTTVAGANILHKLDWMSVRHDRNNEFPILEPEDWHFKNPSPARYNHEMPAYNYGAMDESIVLNLSGSALNPSYFVEESNDSIKEDEAINETESTASTSQRSRTLPVGSLPSQMLSKGSAKHIRSLSESKTSDGIASGSTTNRTRFNSGDSNTSGVSSSDSVNNTKTVINERFRRISLTGTPIRDLTQLSNQDVHGYKKLRIIRRSVRLGSESAADDLLSDIFENDGNSRQPNRLLLPSFNLDSTKRKLQNKNLERQTINISGFDDIQKNIYVAKLLTQIDTKAPCYRGICLPRNILDLFPEHSHSGTYVSRYIREIETLESNCNLSISSTHGFKHHQYQTEDATIPADESAVSSMSDLSAATGNKRMRKRTAVPLDQTLLTGIENVEIPTIRSVSSNTGGGGVGATKHNRNECILCCRSKVITKLVDTSLNIQEPKENLTSMNGKIGDSEISFYSPESIVSDDSANTNMPDRISNVILRNCQKMANPILFKNCRKVLMELKQKYPQSFQDPCLYSEVCKYMSTCSYRMTVRRFIQEIFLDLNYDQLCTNSDFDLIINIARQRLADLNLLDSSKSFPSSPPPPLPASASSSLSSLATTSTVQYTQAILQHKIHSLKSPLLASVYETSIENLIDSQSQSSQPFKVIESKDQVDSIITIRKSSPSKGSSSSSQQVKAEIHSYRHSSVLESAAAEPLVDMSSEALQPIRRRRFNTLELDLSCTKNKFPIRHRSQQLTIDGPLATSTLQRNVSTSANTPQQQSLEMHYSKISSSSSSSLQLSSPLSPPTLGTLFCEQRLLQSRSEATLSSSSNNNNNNNNVENNNKIMMMNRKKNDEELR